LRNVDQSVIHVLEQFLLRQTDRHVQSSIPLTSLNLGRGK